MVRAMQRCTARLLRQGALFGCLAAIAGSGFAADTFRVGTNLAELADYSTEVPFLDVFKMGREWFTASASVFDTDEASRLNLDASGWIKSLTPTGSGSARFDRACTLIFSMAAVEAGSQKGKLPYPAGQYVVRYDGEGTLDYRLAASKNSALSSAGRDVIDVKPQEPGIQICITATDPQKTGNYLRNIRVYLPGHEALAGTETFNPDFLGRLRPYTALRFMDWMRTNNSTLEKAADQPQASDYIYSRSAGVPAEIMIKLANQLEADPWFNMPQKASDDYVAKFAAQVASGLNANRAVYVEYSNEIWNDQFSQGQAIQSEGVAKFAGKSGSDFDKRLNRFGERTAEICDLWRSAFGTGAARVRCVMAGQAANAYIAETALNCAMSTQAPCKNHGIYGIAIAPYIGDWVGLSQHENKVAAWAAESDGGLGRLFNELDNGKELNDADAGGGLPTVLARITSHATLASQQGLQLIAYEGGQHLVGVGSAASNDTINTLFNAANRDTRMGTLYSTYLNQWKQRGGGLFMHFNDIGNATRFGRWGALEILSQTTSPKHDALVGATASCLFTWAEREYPQFFSPAGSGTSGTLDPYTYRYYPATGNYLATSAADGHVWVLGNSFGTQPLDVGAMTGFLSGAGCR